jgi:hypothetical protein
MEPPPKRLRILQSADVDETNPDYVEAKQKQQQKFKGRLESIFAKFEGMHESMSDEIDFTTNQIVVDRGHLRRLDRQEKRQPGSILNEFLGAGPAHDDVSEQSGGDESEDELAPTQVPKATGDASSPLPQSAHPDALPTHPVASVAPQTPAQQASNTPNPSANLLQLVQFPQTPQGQQAQTAFYATLQQTINQAVQQAVAPFFSSMLSNTPAAQRPLAPLFAVPTTPATTADAVAPATDPKWYFPPMHTVEPAAHTAQSSPLQFNTKTPLKESRLAHLNKKSTALPQRIQVSTKKGPTQAITQEDNGVVNLDTENYSSPVDQMRASPRVVIPLRQPVTVRRKLPGYRGNETKTTRLAKDTPTQRQRSPNDPRTIEETPETPEITIVEPATKEMSEKAAGSDGERGSATLPVTATRKRTKTKKYHYTKEDDQYIIRQRKLHKRPWLEIRASKEKWKDWPLSTFYKHWTMELKDKSLNLEETAVPAPNLEASSTNSLKQLDPDSSIEIPESSPQLHHLPTPSSIKQDEDCSELETVASQRHADALPPSSSHYNDDDLELLSLQGADTADEQYRTDEGGDESDEEEGDEDEDEDAVSTSPDDVLPSIEGCEFINEDALQQDLLQCSSDDDDDEAESREDTVPQTYHTAVPSPTQTRTQAPDHASTLDPKAHAQHADDNDDLAPASPSPVPYIKRESVSVSLTPQPVQATPCTSTSTSISTSASTSIFATPRTAPQSQSSGLLSSSFASSSQGSAGDTKLSRKAFLAQVKKSWARTPGSSAKAGAKRKSLQGCAPLARKRVWDEVEVEGKAEVDGSEDELAG